MEVFIIAAESCRNLEEDDYGKGILLFWDQVCGWFLCCMVSCVHGPVNLMASIQQVR